MITKNKYSKIFIFAPSLAVTGGQECLHQLCDALNNTNNNAFIVYYPDSKTPIPEAYNKYNIKTSIEVEDHNDNILVLHESQYDRIADFKNIQVVMWWLSVDNFFKSSTRYLSVFEYIKESPQYALKAFFNKIYYLIVRRQNMYKRILRLENLKDPRFIHLYQSYYAKDFLEKHNFKNLFPLFDYINTEYLISQKIEKENTILYNPKKGIRFTKKLVTGRPDLNWFPIINMNRSQITEKMNQCKVYIDFGNHPGRDKIPREAAISGCCIITGKLGSAKFDGDIPISAKYKFDQDIKNIDSIYAMIENLLSDYDNKIDEFKDYRNMVINSKNLFEEQVDKIFNK